MSIVLSAGTVGSLGLMCVFFAVGIVGGPCSAPAFAVFGYIIELSLLCGAVRISITLETKLGGKICLQERKVKAELTPSLTPELAIDVYLEIFVIRGGLTLWDGADSNSCGHSPATLSRLHSLRDTGGIRTSLSRPRTLRHVELMLLST